jgi:hypothetical protein
MNKTAPRLNGWAPAALSVFVINLVSSINLLVLPASSQAAEPPSSPSVAQRAKQHYLKGEAYFKAHDFSAAMGEYQSGYEEKADPVFVFNIAQCQRLLGHLGPALESYRRYLREAPEGAGRAVAERQIADLERLTGVEATTPSASPPLPSAGATNIAGAPPVVTPEGPTTIETPPPLPSPSSPSHAVGPEPSVAPPSSTALAESPTMTTRSLAAVDTTSPTVAASPALAIRTDQEPAPPLYRRWWFWAAAGALSIATIVAISAASSGGKPACDADRVCR